MNSPDSGAAAQERIMSQARERIKAVQSLQAELNRLTTPNSSEKEDLRNMQTPTQPTLIGLGGKLGSGKDAFADILVEQFGFHKLGMSDVLADALYTLNPMILVPVEESDSAFWSQRSKPVRYQLIIEERGYVEAKKIPEVRRLLQVLGTEVGREMLGQNIWSDGARRRIQALRAQRHPVVITGLRFPNEINMVTEEGGETAYVLRPEAELTHMETSAASAHVSEGAGPQQFSRVFMNDRTLDHLTDLATEWAFAQGLPTVAARA